ncbi:MAG: enoyl-CoA hydratase/isomerase family protein [Gammaproteobacteria bacterium]|nr:enoyl-CoA hydratase/isomerase family protein [Gammaproteobacteria bacterium]MCP5200188.1 enoyl-CoA hydratase/isomerase family protein [Gammaproteobacteria bacterium]
MSVAAPVAFDARDGIAVIALQRAPVNAVDHPLIDALHAALRRAEADPDVRAVILTSALDGMFCGGMDLKMVAAGDAADLRAFVYKFYMETMNIVYAMSKPLIAALNGPARGAGMTLAINCDVVIAADDIDLGYPEIDVGVIPAIHYVHLPRQISRNQAFELLFGGRPIPVARAVALGLVNRAVPRADLMAAARDMAALFAAKSPAIMALGRQSFMRANDLDYRRNVENQIETLCNVFDTADGREGLQAFVEKRPPRWQGR